MTLKLRKLFYDVPVGSDEQERLEDLYALRILDEASEQRFDQYTELLATVLKAPIALVSLNDDGEQRVKSAFGINSDKVPRESVFFERALSGNGLFVVADASTDEQFANDPLLAGSPTPCFCACATIRAPTGKPLGACCVMDYAPRTLMKHEESTLRKVTRLVEHEMQMDIETTDLKKALQSTALLDSTTGLPNLALFSERLDQTIDLASTNAASLLLALIRVDRFDAIEAAIGRDLASFLLRKLVERIEDVSEGQALTGQVRDDKLGVIVPLVDGTTPEYVLDRILTCIEAPFILDAHTVQLRASIGASVFPKDASTGKSLIKRARTALWSKPNSGRSEYRLFRRRQSNAAMRYFRLESALKGALDRNEFNLVFQPKLCVRSRRLTGAEALIRWRSGQLGDISPSTFIPVAENCGLISEIGNWVLDKACQQLADWRAAGYLCPEIAVNVASSQLREQGFVEGVFTLLQRYELQGELLNLELTEGSLIEDMVGAIRIMRQLRKMGVTIAIDDFGTGFSSLSYLRKMPLRTLKIDRAFIRDIPNSPDDMKIARSIVSMAHDLDLQVVAEGVETEEQLAFLLTAACDQVQGYLLSRPIGPDEFCSKFLSDLREVRSESL